MAHHGAGGGAGGGHGGTENVNVGPLLTIVCAVPIMALLFWWWKSHYRGIIAALLILPGLFLVEPVATCIILGIVVAYGILYATSKTQKGP